MKTKHSHEGGFGILAVVVIVAIVGLIGTGGYYASKSSRIDIESPKDDKVTVGATTTANINSSVSIKSLLALQKSLSCTFTRVDNNSTTSGTVYISGGQFRGDFNTTLKSGGTVDSHIIQKDNKSYLWSSAQGNQGIVMNLAGGSSMQANTSAQSSIDIDEALEYKCSDWTADSSKFMTPSGTTFTDLSAMMKVGM